MRLNEFDVILSLPVCVCSGLSALWRVRCSCEENKNFISKNLPQKHRAVHCTDMSLNSIPFEKQKEIALCNLRNAHANMN